MLIDQLFEDLDLTVEPFAMCEIARGSSLAIGDRGWVTLHFVLAGTGSVAINPSEAADLARYTLVLVRRSHLLTGAGSDGGPGGTTRVDGLERLVGVPEGDADFIAACGRLKAVYGKGLGLFDLMPDPLVLDFSDSDEMRRAFDVMLAESSSGSPGSRSMISALMRQCLVLVFRRLGQGETVRVAWLDALSDDRMAPALEEILAHPGNPHSVELLATRASMSRSSFAARFAECFGRTPMRFVRHVRLQRAADLLRTTDLSIGTVSSRVGYSSRSHFSRAFRDDFGLSPGAFRRSQHS